MASLGNSRGVATNIDDEGRSGNGGQAGSSDSALAGGEVAPVSVQPQAQDKQRVCFDFGSMGCLGLLGPAHRLLQVLLSVAEQLDVQATLLTGSLPGECLH